MRTRKWATVALGAAVLAATPAGGARADVPVDLELVLAIDISGSVDVDEARLQREGYLKALVHPDVIQAIEAGYRRAIAVTYVEWSGAFSDSVLVGWTEIKDAATAAAFVGRLAALPINRGLYTSISNAIQASVPMFDDNGFDGARRVIDISGDGANNDGDLVTTARDAAVAAKVVINGLPIVNNKLNPFGRPQIPDLDLYYRHCVIGGTGSFIVVAKGFDAFADAIRRKLIFEIAGRDRGPIVPVVYRSAQPLPAGVTLASAAAPLVPPAAMPSQLLPIARTPPPCDIGERMREQRRRFYDDN